jgi:hypothetical protein
MSVLLMSFQVTKYISKITLNGCARKCLTFLLFPDTKLPYIYLKFIVKICALSSQITTVVS